MANPRKFSEKIALHNQKQAEETAAFEAIMREVSGATRPPALPAYQKHHLHIAQNLGAYRGGSLPNVNQITANSHTIDLQNALHNLEDMKHGRQSLAADRVYRDRARQVHRGRVLPFDKRNDCSPYGSAYLSPPPDGSWRRSYLESGQLARTNSDSALHTSATMGMEHMTSAPITPPGNRRGNIEMDSSVHGDNSHLKAYWDPKKFQSRPKSCEVPNINIYPSQDPDSGLPHIPISNNTGSLPDLTTLHFPSPMVTPIDVEDGHPPSYHGSMSLGIQQSPLRRRHPHAVPNPLVLNHTTNHMQLPLSPPVAPSKLALDARLRHQYTAHQRPPRQRSGGGGPGPGGGGGTSPSPPHPSPVLSPTHHARSSLRQVPETMSVDREIHDQLATLSDEQINALQAAASSLSQQLADQVSDITEIPLLSELPISDIPIRDIPLNGGQTDVPLTNIPISPHRTNQPLTSPPQHSPGQSHSPNQATQHGQSPGQSPTRLNHSPTQPSHSQSSPGSRTRQREPSMTQYRNSTDCQSPTSPLSQPSHSPSQSPSLTNHANNALFSDAFYLQQQQANSLQHQFEQFNMLPENQLITTSPTTTVPPPNDFMFSGDQNASVSLSQALASQLSDFSTINCKGGGLDLSQLPQLLNNPQLYQLSSSLPNNKIPDIIFTGVDDPLSRQDLSKELGNAITGFTDSFDSDLFPSDDALKVGLDPLDLDGLQMLTDPSLVTDPATEDTFRLDRL